MRQESPANGGGGAPTEGSAAVGGAPDVPSAVSVGCATPVPGAAAAAAAPTPASSAAVVLAGHTHHPVSAAPATAPGVGEAQRGEIQAETHQERHHWRRQVQRELRDQLVNGMLGELQRIMGEANVRHLRKCASRYESFVWKKSANQDQYKQKLERRIESLRRQPSQSEASPLHLSDTPPLSSEAASPLHGSETGDAAWALLATPHHRSRKSSGSKRAGKRPIRRSGSLPSSPYASSVSSISSSSPRSSVPSASQVARDELYFARLRVMKAKYRDEVALVFRELCRVNTVIQHSASLRRHESNNLGDFLANLKKIIYLLEQQPDEMNGMIPARKRTLEYLDVVESHIQRKVLPILHRLRHTYSTILRPIVINYLRNSTRHFRRL